MKVFGSIKELVSTVFRKDSKEVTLQPNQSVTYSADRTVQLPAKDGNAVLVSSGDIVNADIASGAAIAYSKLALSNSIVNADIAAGASVAYSKLNLSGSIVNADISNTAAIDAAKIGAGVVSNTEFGYLDGVTSAIQTQINGKQATITGAATTITSSDLTVSKALQSDASGKVSASSVTSTELGYVSGVTSSIQTQLTSKAAKGANSDITSLSGLTTALSIGQGGTGQTTQQAAMNALAGTQTANRVLRSDGTNTTLSQVALATDVSGTLPIGSGGTGQTTANAALNAFLPSQTSAANKYLKSDGTNTSWASASGGAGEINAVLNASGADGTTGWTGTSVVTGANSPLNPIVTTAFSISNAATTESSTSGGYYPLTLPTGLMNRKLKIEFSYTTPATDVYKVSVYKGSTRVALSTDSGSPASTSLPASVTGGKFVAYFDTDGSSSWTVSVTRTSGTTGPCYITNVIVGPGIQPQGAVVSAPIAYTPSTDGFGTVAGVTAFYTRRGNYIKIQGRFTTGTVNANTAFVSLPAGLNIDTSSVSANIVAGKWWRNIATAGVRKTGGLATDIGVNTNIIRFVNDDYSTGVAPGTTLAGNAVAGTGEVIWFDAELPIAEWAGSGTLTVAQNDVEYAWNSSTSGTGDSSSFGYGPAGFAIPSVTPSAGSSTTQTYRVRFQTPIQSSDKLTLEFQEPSTGRWFDGAVDFPYMHIKATVYGVRLRDVNGTDVDVQFGAGGSSAFNAVNYGDSGTAWSGLSTWKWRVRKSSAGAAVGFGIVSPGVSAGLVSASGLPGNTTGNAIASGYVGEYVTWTTPPANQTATTTEADWTNATITLTTGIWLITANITVSATTGVIAAQEQNISVKITDSTNAIVSNLDKLVTIRTTTAAANYFLGVIPYSSRVVVTDASKVFKIRIVRGYSDGTALAYNSAAVRSEFFAVRIA